MNILNFISLIVLSGVLLIAAIYDLRVQKIPNRLTFPTIVVAIAYRTGFNGWDGFVYSVEGVGVGLGLMLLPYLMGGMGAGDAKLMGAVGGFLGPKGVFVAFLFTALIGGLYAVLLLIYSRNLMNTVKRYGLIVKIFLLSRKFTYFAPSEEVKKLRLRYGIAIALGTLFSVFLRNTINNYFV